MNYPEFRTLLSAAIGKRTQAKFAEDADLNPTYVNRLLKKPDIPRPSVATLRAICDASHGLVSMASLLESCGFDPQNVPEQPKESSDVLDIILNYKRGLMRFAGVATRYDGLEDVFETVDMLYGEKGIRMQYELEDSQFFKERGHYGAERYTNVTASWTTDEYSCEFGFVAYFCKTEKEGLILSDVAFDLPTLIKMQHKIGMKKMFDLSVVPDVVLSDYQTVYYKKELKTD